MVLLQSPNAALIGLLTGMVMSRFTAVGTPLHRIGYALYVVAGVIWCYQEITQGVNWFRRLLGAVVLAFIIAALLR